MTNVKKQYTVSPNWVCSDHVGSFSGGSPDLKDEEEDVNNVNVERECSKYVLLWVDGQLTVSNEQLGVVYQKLQQRERSKKAELEICVNLLMRAGWY